MICDFCSDPGPVWSFDCEGFDLEYKARSLGAWVACEACAALIRSKAWHELAKRAAEENPNGRMMVDLVGKPAAIKQIEEMHEGFRRHATGMMRIIKI